MPPTGSRLQRLLRSDIAAAWILVAAVVVALIWANRSWSDTYAAVWLHSTHIGGRTFDGFTSVRDWVNGGLMAVFFLVVGLEIGRERRRGDLADVRTAVVPVAGALGGMAGAGLVYAAVAHGGPASSGWGIPMATDIAFALGALALLGRWVPSGLRVFILTLAVADDIGSVLVMAVFYSSRTRPLPLIAAAAVVVALVVLRRFTRASTAAVVVGGVALWVLLAAGGVEPALAGVVAGLLVPGRTVAGGPDPAERLEQQVAPWSAFVVLPLFALANAGITFHAGMLAGAGTAAVFWGVGLARVVGKLGGITLACLAVVGLRLGRLPVGVRWRHLAGGAAVAGIGFTVPLLIAELAFVHQPHLVAAAELGLFAGSAAAFAVGAAILLWSGADGPTGSPESRGDAGDGPEEPSIPW